MPAVRRSFVSVLVLASGCSGSIEGSRAPGDAPRDFAPSDAEPDPKTPVNPPPSAEAPVQGLDGILGCPTVDLPAYAVTASADLSAAFRDTCASCHGPTGAGLGPYPAIPGALSLAEFKAKVRGGTENMPPFDARFVGDADLERDYEALRKLQASAVGALPRGGEWTWAEADVARAYERGLSAFRKLGHDGAACASCHAPDGIDLAVIGYPDASILRRAYHHLAPEDALLVRDFVHAQRRRFSIRRPCAPTFRPFQPGGEVLPGATPEEQDLAFGRELVRRKLLVAAGTLDSIESAKRAWNELVALDVRKLPIGVPLPRWTEDRFHGDEHRSVNDYLPNVPRVPADPRWYELADAYLANPSNARLFALVSSVHELTTDGGFVAARSQPLAGCNEYLKAGQWPAEVAEIKFRSVLVASHYFRLAVLGKPGWLDRDPNGVPFGAEGPLNPFFYLAGKNVEHVCYNHYPSVDYVMAALPDDMRAEMPRPGAKADQRFDGFAKTINHPWFVLGHLYDPSFFSNEPLEGDGTAWFNRKIHYWSTLNSVHNYLHEPFLNAHRIAVQTAWMRDRKTRAAFPRNPSWYGRGRALPFLDGDRMLQERLAQEIDGRDPRAALAVRLKTNLIRMWLYLEREALEGGASVNNKENLRLFLGTQTEFSNAPRNWRAFGNHVVALIDGGAFVTAPDVVADRAYFASTGALADEVLQLIEKAPSVPAASSY